MSPTYQVLTFDVVGTLIDFEAGILACIHGLFGSHHAPVGDEEILEAFARAEARQQQETPQLPFTQMLAPIYERMSSELDLPAGESAADALRVSIPDWPAFPDAAVALAQLRGRFRLVAVTNADNWATRCMAATLGEPFDDTVTAEDVGVNKPDAQVFAYCRGRQSTLGYTLGDYLHVAQSQYHDIAVAKRLGYRTCWIERRADRPRFGATPTPLQITTPDLHYRSLTELVDHLDQPAQAMTWS